MTAFITTALISIVIGFVAGVLVARRVFSRVVDAYHATAEEALRDAYGKLAKRKKAGRRRGMTVRRLRTPRPKAG